MNLAKDAVLRGRMMTMVQAVYEKATVPPTKAAGAMLTLAERKAIDRCVVKYLETAKYVKKSFEEAKKRVEVK